MIRTVPTRPFEGQKPGTSGLRKKVRVFQQPNYTENFLQSIFDVAPPGAGAALVVGGDGRFHNRTVIQQALRIAAANGFARAIVGQGGILSTPAASHLIRKNGAAGGLIFSASHNPGGPDADFGIKYNVANGGPAPEAVTEAVYRRTLEIDRWLTIDAPDIELDRLGATRIGAMEVEVIDPVADYAELMESLFDFAAIRRWREAGGSFAFDAMNAVTGPYAHDIFERRLGFAPGTVRRGTPLEDFGGGHPDPNLTHAPELAALMMGPDAPDLGAASDGDGDRNLIIGRGLPINPSDSLAMIAANAHLAPAYRGGIAGIARSMPTSTAADQVARRLGIGMFETPTGWKFFGSLLDAGLVTVCGEESAGTGSDHVREKDGLWAVLMWLNILAARGQSVAEIARDHWATHGRNYYARHDYEALPVEAANALMAELEAACPALCGRSFGEFTVAGAAPYAYRDPVDGSESRGQGIVIPFTDGSRVIFRLSGTGTEGATLRAYLDRFEAPGGRLDAQVDEMLGPLAEIAEEVAGIARHTGRSAPDLIT
ncbi:alpha-D-glucose phosphate-specific phosphoglucomutase [Sphingomonas mesophila]|uniref:alpha-D-glucose phosphate-specific phosphoglucomutase n=1 Tax=Sphingomonas mesophila TaxID=2303576 RepID=UPI000E592B61|nr:alpha-D-glucose phosphate-specific phosphoglucomutase [Sphingomonas mesophila]